MTPQVAAEVLPRDSSSKSRLRGREQAPTALQLEYVCVHIARLGLYVLCVDSSEVDRDVGPKEHWNNAALLWKITEYHPDTGHLAQS